MGQNYRQYEDITKHVFDRCKDVLNGIAKSAISGAIIGGLNGAASAAN